ncbi:MAG: DUF2225 domain-containing protein [Fibrobacterota bacterium]|nr:DUF2225 domain-containing protein [Fibrobacterota bacterium]
MGLDDKLVRKKLEVLLKDEILVEKYIRVFGPKLDMNHITKIKQDAMRSAPEGSQGEKDDPTYQIKVKCPICNQGDIICFEIKAKSLTTTPDRFLVPRYAGVKPFRTINYSLFAVTVCPSCLFASPDKRDFITFSVQTRTENKSQLGPFVLEELRKKVEARKGLINEKDFTAFFGHPRKVEAGIASYRLAIHRALVEATLETPLAWYKAGMYALKVALLTRDSGMSDDVILKEAVDYLAKSFRASELKHPELEYQLVYLLSTLYLRLEDQTQCQNYMGVLDKWKSELAKEAKDNPAINTAHVDRWLDKVKVLWTDRETPDLWKH